MAKLIQVDNRIINIDHVIEFVRKEYKTGPSITINLAAGSEQGSDSMILVQGEDVDKLWDWLKSQVKIACLKGSK